MRTIILPLLLALTACGPDLSPDSDAGYTLIQVIVPHEGAACTMPGQGGCEADFFPVADAGTTLWKCELDGGWHQYPCQTKACTNDGNQVSCQ